MRAAPTAQRLLPVCVIGLVMLLLSFTSATATTLATRSSIHAKVKVPPQAETEPMGKEKPNADEKQTGKDKPKLKDQPKAADETKPQDQSKPKDKPKRKDESGDKSNPSGNGAAEPVQVEAQLPSSATAVTPVGPPAAVQPTVTVGATTESGRGELETQATKEARQRTAARSKRKRRGASAGSTPHPLSAPLAGAAAARQVRAARTTSRARKPEQRRPARRSVVEPLTDSGCSLRSPSPQGSRSPPFDRGGGPGARRPKRWSIP
jgi:hypothetical protein